MTMSNAGNSLQVKQNLRSETVNISGQNVSSELCSTCCLILENKQSSRFSFQISSTWTSALLANFVKLPLFRNLDMKSAMSAFLLWIRSNEWHSTPRGLNKILPGLATHCWECAVLSENPLDDILPALSTAVWRSTADNYPTSPTHNTLKSRA